MSSVLIVAKIYHLARLAIWDAYAHDEDKLTVYTEELDKLFNQLELTD